MFPLNCDEIKDTSLKEDSALGTMTDILNNLLHNLHMEVIFGTWDVASSYSFCARTLNA
jgi:hypothetical protein